MRARSIALLRLVQVTSRLLLARRLVLVDAIRGLTFDRLEACRCPLVGRLVGRGLDLVELLLFQWLRL